MEEVEEVEEAVRRRVRIDEIEDIEAEGIRRLSKLVFYPETNNMIDMNSLPHDNVEYQMNIPTVESEVVRKIEPLISFNTNSI